jgi:isoleucyl-tRNA synthetase
VYSEQTGKLLVMTTDLASNLPEEKDFEVLATLSGAGLIGRSTIYLHPLYDRKSPVLAGGDYTTTTTGSGTGLVHTAPGHGQEEYLTGLKNGLDILSPVDDVGRFFTVEAGERFRGMNVLGEQRSRLFSVQQTSGLLVLKDSATPL